MLFSGFQLDGFSCFSRWRRRASSLACGHFLRCYCRTGGVASLIPLAVLREHSWTEIVFFSVPKNTTKNCVILEKPAFELYKYIIDARCVLCVPVCRKQFTTESSVPWWWEDPWVPNDGKPGVRSQWPWSLWETLGTTPKPGIGATGFRVWEPRDDGQLEVWEIDRNQHPPMVGVWTLRGLLQWHPNSHPLGTPKGGSRKCIESVAGSFQVCHHVADLPRRTQAFQAQPKTPACAPLPRVVQEVGLLRSVRLATAADWGVANAIRSTVDRRNWSSLWCWRRFLAVFFCLEVRIGSDVPYQVPFVFDINHILRHFAGISGLLNFDVYAHFKMFFF